MGGCPGVSLTLCCFVVCSTRRFVLCLTLCQFFLVFSPFSIAITSLGEERANLSAFHTFADLCLFGFVGFLFLLVSAKGCGLWLWHSLDFSLTIFFICAACFVLICYSSLLLLVPRKGSALYLRHFLGIFTDVFTKTRWWVRVYKLNQKVSWKLHES